MRYVLLLLALISLNSAVSATIPPPPPPPESAALAVAILEDRPAPDHQLSGLVEWRARELSVHMLRTIRMKPGSRAWREKHARLTRHFVDRLSPQVAAGQSAYMICLAGQLAYENLEYLDEIRSFLRSNASRAIRFIIDQQASSAAFHCASRNLGNTEMLVMDAWQVIGERRRRPPPQPL
jgi:hypothetical protein